jgi:hypothetical protein
MTGGSHALHSGRVRRCDAGRMPSYWGRNRRAHNEPTPEEQLMWHQVVPAAPNTTATFDPGPRKRTLDLPVLGYDHYGEPMVLVGRQGLMEANAFAEANGLKFMFLGRSEPPVIVPAQPGLTAIYDQRKRRPRRRINVPVVAWKVYPDQTDCTEPVVFLNDVLGDGSILIDVVDAEGRSIMQPADPEVTE